MSERSGGTLYGGVEIPGHPCLENVAKLDRLAIPLIRKAHRIGIAIDREYFHDLSSKFATEIIELERDIANYIPVDKLREFSGALSGEDEDSEEDNSEVTIEFRRSQFNASSPEQIGKLLYDILGIGASKRLKKTASGKLSTGKKQLEQIKLEHPVVPRILRHREISKLKTTYSDKLPRLAVFHPHGPHCPICGFTHFAPTWRIHCQMGTTRADTGRINHRDPNEGNVPSRTTDGQAIQAGHIATPGCKLVNGDLSQIELRGLAHLSNCPAMIQAYLNHEDLHDKNARKIFKLAEDVKPDKIKHRLAAKRVGFGLQNGTTEKGLYLQLVMDYGANDLPIPDWLTEDWCEWFIAEFKAANPEVVEWFELQWFRARRYGMVWTPMGRIKLIPEVQSTHSWVRESGLRQAQNMPVTGLAADQLKLAMGRITDVLEDLNRQGIYAVPILTIHDAIMIEADAEHADDVLDILLMCLDEVMNDVNTGELLFRVPIESDGSVMERWAK